MGLRSALATALVLLAGPCVSGGLVTQAARGQSVPVAGAAQCGTNHWVATWSADPTGALGGGFGDQSLRIILTPHVGGTELRVHLSNRFGSKAVTFARASVALRQSGAALVAGSGRQLTFSGQTSVSVAPGGEAVSDAASLTFAPFQDLAVSLYLAEATGPASGHLIARERSYASARGSGDHTGEEAAGAFGAPTTAVDYVDAVDALEPAGVGAAVLFGDSLTDGYENAGAVGAEDQGGIDANHRYPDYLARRLLAEPGGPRLSVVNAGISGNRLLADSQQGFAGMSGLSRLDGDVLGVAGVTDAIVLEGINDIGSQATASQVIAALGQIVVRLHDRGVRVLLGTITPAGTGLLNLGSLLPAIYIDTSANLVRVAVNSWIRNGAGGADGVVDFDAAVSGTFISNELNPGLDSGDHVHPSSAGYSRMADAVNLASLRSPQCTPPPPPIATRLRVRARARSAERLRVTGSLLTAAPADCTGLQIVLRALHAHHRILQRRLRVSSACHFAATRRLHARGKIEVRLSFVGSPRLLPAHTRPLYVRVR